MNIAIVLLVLGIHVPASYSVSYKFAIVGTNAKAGQFWDPNADPTGSNKTDNFGEFLSIWIFISIFTQMPSSRDQTSNHCTLCAFPGYDRHNQWPATASCNGKLYISGGRTNTNYSPLNATVVWDSATDTHTDGPRLLTPRYDHSMDCVNEASGNPDLIICGGQGDHFLTLKSCEVILYNGLMLKIK